MPPSAISNRPGAIFYGAGKGAFGVAEKFAFVKFLGNRRVPIDVDQGLVAALAAAMDFMGDKFLAGASLAEAQNRRVSGRDQIDLADDLA